jgi:4-hydroxybenzoate polyprenyltransferase
LTNNNSSNEKIKKNLTSTCSNDGVNINGSIAASSISHQVDITDESASTTTSHYPNNQQTCQPSSSKPFIAINQNNDNRFLYSILLPPSLHPYARLSRLDKPIGTFLLLHPCLWSVALASSSASSASATILPSMSEITSPLSSSTTTTIVSGPNLGELATNTTSTTTANLLYHHLPLLDSTSSILPNITPFLSLCTTFALGSFIMRSAGCTINDMWDASYDKNVERTKSRPLASGEITHLQAGQFLVVQLLAGLGVLVSLPHVEECMIWGVASLPLVVAYPLMKRYTHFPQVVLGMTFNWGAVLGWVAVRGGGEAIDWTIVGPLYVAGIAWTVVYDTLYAHQDKKDDAKLGLKSTALTFGDRWTKPILTGCTGVAWGGWMMAGYHCGFGTTADVVTLSALLGQEGDIASATTAAFAAQYAYYAGVSAAASHLLWQIYTADLQNANNLAYRFKSNNLVGWIVFGSCCVAAGGSNLTAVG